MQCPVCSNTSLVMAERAGIEIDYCPQCRGVWLDRGELDKIIERSSAPQAAAPQNVQPQQAPRQEAPSRDAYERDSYNRDARGHDPYRPDPYRKKRKEGFLSELFDFD